MITYEKKFGGGSGPWTLVHLEGKQVGVIKPVTGGFQYFPLRGEGGTVHPTIQAVKREIEGE